MEKGRHLLYYVCPQGWNVKVGVENPNTTTLQPCCVVLHSTNANSTRASSILVGYVELLNANAAIALAAHTGLMLTSHNPARLQGQCVPSSLL